MLSKVFVRPLRTMSLCNCYLLCVIAICYVFYSTVYKLSLSVFLPCWRIPVFMILNITRCIAVVGADNWLDCHAARSRWRNCQRSPDSDIKTSPTGHHSDTASHAANRYHCCHIYRNVSHDNRRVAHFSRTSDLQLVLSSSVAWKLFYRHLWLSVGMEFLVGLFAEYRC